MDPPHLEAGPTGGWVSGTYLILTHPRSGLRGYNFEVILHTPALLAGPLGGTAFRPTSVIFSVHMLALSDAPVLPWGTHIGSYNQILLRRTVRQIC